MADRITRDEGRKVFARLRQLQRDGIIAMPKGLPRNPTLTDKGKEFIKWAQMVEPEESQE